MNQGAEANHSGQILKIALRKELEKRGFHFRSHSDDGGNLDALSSRLVIEGYPQGTIYQGIKRSPFLIIKDDRRVRVECIWQEVNGSVEQKLPYHIANAKIAPEKEILILHGGGGASPEALEYLKREARRAAPAKTIYVININAFFRWVRDVLLPEDNIQEQPIDQMEMTV